MLEVLPESSENRLVLRASGKLTDADYQQLLIPRLEEMIAAHGKVRLLLELADTFAGWEPAAAWDDARFGLAHRHDFEKMAVVGGPQWVAWAMKIGGMLIDGELRAFPYEERGRALAWLLD